MKKLNSVSYALDGFDEDSVRAVNGVVSYLREAGYRANIGISDRTLYAVVLVDRSIENPDSLFNDDINGVPLGYRLCSPAFLSGKRSKVLKKIF